MKKINFLLLTLLIVTSCTVLQEIMNNSTSIVVPKNQCDIFTFSDSTHFNSVYDQLENQLENLVVNDADENADEEINLTEFENINFHYSFRRKVLDQLNNLENQDIEINETNDPDDLLFDDVVLQSILSQERLVIIGDVVFYYYDDCTLYKFYNYYNNCEEIKIMARSLPKSRTYYEVVDICDDYSSFRMAQTQEVPCEMEYLIEFNSSTPDVCNPNIVELEIYHSQSNYTLLSGDVTIYNDGTQIEQYDLDLNQWQQIDEIILPYYADEYDFEVEIEVEYEYYVQEKNSNGTWEEVKKTCGPISNQYSITVEPEECPIRQIGSSINELNVSLRDSSYKCVHVK